MPPVSPNSATQLRLQFFLKIAALLLYAKIRKIEIMPICFFRSADEQAALYAQGRTKSGEIVTYFDGYQRKSAHQLWRAIDFVVVIDDELVWERTPEYEILGSFWLKLGGTWGGDFHSLNDIYHFEG
jgi:peptidoglycan L-alanyl-D-glutamate endopeptidase CwlK